MAEDSLTFIFGDHAIVNWDNRHELTLCVSEADQDSPTWLAGYKVSKKKQTPFRFHFLILCLAYVC